MSVYASIDFVAPYSEKLVKFLDEGDYYSYKNCTENDFVRGTILSAYNYHASSELAELFGIKYRDASTHHIKKDLKVDEMFEASLYGICSLADDEQDSLPEEIDLLKYFLKDPRCHLFFSFY